MTIVAAPREMGARAESRSRETRTETLHFIEGLLLLRRLRFLCGLLFVLGKIRANSCVGGFLAVQALGGQSPVSLFGDDHERHRVIPENCASCAAWCLESLHFSDFGSERRRFPL